MRRLTFAVSLTVAVLAVLWTGAWFLLAGWLDRTVTAALASVSEHGMVVECGDRDIGGFPFALRVDCTQADFRAAGGPAGKLAGLVGGGSIFAPRTLAVRLTAPAEVLAPELGAPIGLRWEAAGGEVALASRGPERLSARLTAAQIESGVGTLAAEAAEGMLTPAEDGGSVVALRLSGLRAGAEGWALPQVEANLAAHVSQPPHALLSGRLRADGGTEIPDFQLRLASGDLQAHASGTLRIDQAGILDGVLSVKVAGLEHLPAFLAALPADSRAAASTVAGALMLGRASTLDGEPAREIEIEIGGGAVQIGGMQLLTLPAF